MAGPRARWRADWGTARAGTRNRMLHHSPAAIRDSTAGPHLCILQSHAFVLANSITYTRNPLTRAVSWNRAGGASAAAGRTAGQQTLHSGGTVLPAPLKGMRVPPRAGARRKTVDSGIHDRRRIPDSYSLPPAGSQRARNESARICPPSSGPRSSKFPPESSGGRYARREVREARPPATYSVLPLTHSLSAAVSLWDRRFRLSTLNRFRAVSNLAVSSQLLIPLSRSVLIHRRCLLRTRHSGAC